MRTQPGLPAPVRSAAPLCAVGSFTVPSPDASAVCLRNPRLVTVRLAHPHRKRAHAVRGGAFHGSAPRVFYGEAPGGVREGSQPSPATRLHTSSGWELRLSGRALPVGLLQLRPAPPPPALEMPGVHGSVHGGRGSAGLWVCVGGSLGPAPASIFKYRLRGVSSPLTLHRPSPLASRPLCSRPALHPAPCGPDPAAPCGPGCNLGWLEAGSPSASYYRGQNCLDFCN